MATATIREWKVSCDEYHKDPSISSSKLRDYVNHGVTYYRAVHIDRTHRPQPTERMLFGSLVHEIVLKPSWARGVAIIPSDVLAKNGARSTNAYRDWAAENQGKWQLKADEADGVAQMLAAMASHPLAADLLLNERCCTEVALITDDDYPNRRCMIDSVAPLGIADLKIHDDLDPQRLAAHIVRMRYDWQLAFYQEMLFNHEKRTRDCYLVFLRSVPPYQCRVVRLKPDWMAAARAEYKQPLSDLEARYVMDDWHELDEDAAVELERPRMADFRDEYSLHDND